MITLADETEALASASTLKFLSETKLRQLALVSERFVFQDGDTIIAQGSGGEDGYILLDGETDVSIDLSDGPRFLATMGKGFIAGDHALIMGGPYKVTVLARGTTHVLRIQREDLLILLDGDREAMSEMLNTLAERKAAAEEMFSISLDDL